LQSVHLILENLGKEKVVTRKTKNQEEINFKFQMSEKEKKGGGE